MWKWWQALACVCCVAVAACGDDECKPELRIAAEVIITGIGRIDKVTIELESEKECGSFYDPGLGQVYTCWEQGGGLYTVRVYSGDTVREKQVEIAADECHIEERASVQIDLQDETL
jgi:hypothetical protein